MFLSLLLFFLLFLFTLLCSFLSFVPFFVSLGGLRRYFLNDFSSSPFSPPSSSLTRKRIRLSFQKREEEEVGHPRNQSKEKKEKKEERVTREEATTLGSKLEDQGESLKDKAEEEKEEELEWILPESFPYREAISSSPDVYWSECYNWHFFSCEMKKTEEEGGGGGCFNNFLFIARKL